MEPTHFAFTDLGRTGGMGVGEDKMNGSIMKSTKVRMYIRRSLQSHGTDTVDWFTGGMQCPLELLRLVWNAGPSRTIETRTSLLNDVCTSTSPVCLVIVYYQNP